MINFQNKIKILISFILTISALLYITNGIMFYYQFSNSSIIGSSFIFGLYIFACMVSNHKYDNYILEPKSFNFKKFVKIIFMPSIILSIITKIIYPEITNNFSIEEMIIFSENNINILLKQEDIFWILPLVLGVFSYFFINFIIYWYLVILWNLLILPITYS